MHKQLMERIKAVDGYSPKPNPNADPKFRNNELATLVDQGSFGSANE